MEGLRFADAVALSADDSVVRVAETGTRPVVRRWVRVATGVLEYRNRHWRGDLVGFAIADFEVWPRQRLDSQGCSSSVGKR